MALRNVVVEGDPVLRKTCRPVDEVTDRIRGILDDMLETMKASYGVGIAAPQVGIMRRMFIAIPDPENDPDGAVYMINPEIIEKSGSQFNEEGCLSVPGLVGTVERPEYIKIKGLDYDGTERTLEFEGFGAIVMSHEYDHLDGILYIDKATDIHEAVYEEEEEE
ncbi:MAG: peptide deformylase [Firmicutes bacterium]|nr:peptide deformylase [Clostridiales bacterium]MBQ2748054.1 peptide deformylase [Bacillota bacterium]MBQ9972921.1 peptide deformylase [Bacillota bacterium]